MVEQNTYTKIFKRNDQGKYVLFQTLKRIGGAQFAYAGAITDDLEWVVFDVKMGFKVYKFNGNHFVFNQTVSTPFTVRHIAMAQDHKFLVVGSFGYEIYVYSHNGSQYNRVQSFSSSLSS